MPGDADLVISLYCYKAAGAGGGIPARETPPHPLALPAFRIGRYLVTNREYAEFLCEVL